MTRRPSYWLGALLLVGLCVPGARANDNDIPVNKRIKGRVVDYTNNHGANHRIWSRSLYQWRDVYVYLPPGYNKNECYPVVLYLHGFCQDEQSLLHVVPELDAAICAKKMPPVIVIAPDGTIDGAACCERPGSLFINSNAGPYEDYVLQDVWDFVVSKYPVRHEREAHAIVGVSMGGFAAYNLGIRHRNCFGAVAGIHPPLNLRWADVDLDPRANFDPRRWGWRCEFNNPHEVLGRHCGHAIRMGDVIEPVFGLGDEATQAISENNPIELVQRTKLCNGELNMFVGFGGRDEFNIDAQVESFLYLAKHRCLGVTVAYDPNGHHNLHTARTFLPALFEWLGPQLGDYCPNATSTPAPTRGHRGHMPRYLP